MRGLLLGLVLAVGCGGNTGHKVIVGENVLSATVDPGPQNIGYTNGLFADVTVCVPGTSDCQVVDHMLVDTGSVGVRVLESILRVDLPRVAASNGSMLAECTAFVDGTAWGPVAVADVQLASATAAGLAVQLIGEDTFTMAQGCSGNAITDFATLGANGILGVGIYLRDCGDACAQPASSLSNPGLYYGCSAPSTCSVASVPVEQQVPNPVAALPSDNNGVVIDLPGIPAGGSALVNGYLILGIGTQSNNDLGSAAALSLDRRGYVGTTFPKGGTTYTSFVDSGSNGLFFLSPAITGLPKCSRSVDFYCPANTTSFGATVQGANGAVQTIAFRVANAETLNGRSCAFDDLAGPMPQFPDSSVPGFDWGLPFFFGRRVFTAIEGRATPAGDGPYFAF